MHRFDSDIPSGEGKKNAEMETGDGDGGRLGQCGVICFDRALGPEALPLRDNKPNVRPRCLPPSLSSIRFK
jgi:hypothetical protein